MNPEHPSPEKKIQVTVTYTGKNDFQESVAPSTRFGAVKLDAMNGFGLDPAKADEYVLQYGDTDLDDGRPVASLGREDVKLRLMLKSEPTKG